MWRDPDTTKGVEGGVNSVDNTGAELGSLLRVQAGKLAELRLDFFHMSEPLMGKKELFHGEIFRLTRIFFIFHKGEVVAGSKPAFYFDYDLNFKFRKGVVILKQQDWDTK